MLLRETTVALSSKLQPAEKLHGFLQRLTTLFRNQPFYISDEEVVQAEVRLEHPVQISRELLADLSEKLIVQAQAGTDIEQTLEYMQICRELFHRIEAPTEATSFIECLRPVLMLAVECHVAWQQGRSTVGVRDPQSLTVNEFNICRILEVFDEVFPLHTDMAGKPRRWFEHLGLMVGSVTADKSLDIP